MLVSVLNIIFRVSTRYSYRFAHFWCVLRSLQVFDERVQPGHAAPDRPIGGRAHDANALPSAQHAPFVARSAFGAARTRLAAAGQLVILVNSATAQRKHATVMVRRSSGQCRRVTADIRRPFSYESRAQHRRRLWATW